MSNHNSKYSNSPPIIETKVGTSPNHIQAIIHAVTGVKYRELVASEALAWDVIYANAIYGSTVGNTPKYITLKVISIGAVTIS